MVDGEIPAALASAFTVNCFWLQSSRILFATACFVFNLLTTAAKALGANEDMTGAELIACFS